MWPACPGTTGTKQNFIRSLSLCWLSSFSLNQTLSDAFSSMIIVTTAQISMSGRKTVRKEPSSSIQDKSFISFLSFFMLKVTLIPLKAEMQKPVMFPWRAVEDLLHTSTRGPCWCLCCCTDPYEPLMLSPWCWAEQPEWELMARG